ncbi:WecB/TagA/CpsF family glycosyltransferase [Crenothrix sp.]|uniref:WecB/TagA/CpsF family glycosyltransferase n=1 Tax=Crenothrix sp. TaxID=3100433 RepID=UPI00374CC622
MKQRINIIGCEIDNLSMEETLQTIEGFIYSGQSHQHVVVNVDKIVKANKDPHLLRIINECALVNVDGMPVVWASYLLGKPLKERVAGIDLFEKLIQRSAEKAWRIYFLGASEEIVSTVNHIYQQKYPNISIAGYHNGYWTTEEEPGLVAQIKNSQTQLLFVALSSPQKENFLSTYQAQLQIPFVMGVGGSFDVIAGKIKRAPPWIQKIGFEWFYRFLQEPRRMFKRYFIEDMAFFWLLVKEFLR